MSNAVLIGGICITMKRGDIGFCLYEVSFRFYPAGKSQMQCSTGQWDQKALCGPLGYFMMKTAEGQDSKVPTGMHLEWNDNDRQYQRGGRWHPGYTTRICKICKESFITGSNRETCGKRECS